MPENNNAHPLPNSIAFWITYLFIIVAIALFVLASFRGMQPILDNISKENSRETVSLIEKYKETSADDSLPLLAWATLEFDTLENRQSRADSLLATRTWLRFMNASFGSILIMSGAIFLLARVRMDKSDFQGDAGKFQFVIATSSPGIVMVVVGAVLVSAPLYVSQKIETNDGQSYPMPLLSDSNFQMIKFGDLTKEELCELARENGLEENDFCE